MATEIILGPPGTGKTTALISLLSDCLSRGVPPHKIGFVSFTKKATEEAKTRSMEKFGFKPEDLPYFRTLHSFCFRQLGMFPAQVMGKENYSEFGKDLGVEIAGYSNEDGDNHGLPVGDKLLFLCGLSRLRCQNLRETWEEVGEDLEWNQVTQFSKALESYKNSRSLRDFTDMLSTFEASGIPPELEILFVDEAQDLSKLQWKIIKRLENASKQTYIAGDDDQCIFRWSGADVSTFINYPGRSRVLDQSYRIPSSVHALSEKIISGCANRRVKKFRPAKKTGTVNYCQGSEDLPLDSGEWLLLTRNNYQIRPLEEACRLAGYHYESKGKSPAQGEALNAVRYYTKGQNKQPLTPEQSQTVSKYRSKRSPGGPWFEALDKLREDDRDYFLSALRRGEKITGPPRIRISTIHGAKGGEADNVGLFTDMSYRTYEAYQNNSDDETRVFYVGATRAKENLHVVLPQTKRFFELC